MTNLYGEDRVSAEKEISETHAPKSNSAYQAISRALHHVESQAVQPVPLHLLDAHYPGAARLGRGQGYRYPHDYPSHFVEQAYRVDGLHFY